MSTDARTVGTNFLGDVSRAELEAAFIDHGCLVTALNLDVVTLQQAMMTIWHLAPDDGEVRIVIERAMAATGMPRAPR